MGWWKAERSEEEIALGDEPLDIIGEALQAITRAYEEEWDRKPTLAEVVQTIEMVLAAGLEDYVSGGDSLELVSLAAKAKKRRKSQPYQVGDFFAIPLGDGRYAFGRILSDSVPGMGLLIGIYKQVNKHILTPEELQGGEFMFTPFYCPPRAWKNWRWKIVGHRPIREGEFVYPKFKQGGPPLGWWIKEENNLYPATEEEVRDLQYPSLKPPEIVEFQIRRYLEE